MKIIQIVLKEDRLFYGLGGDSKIYIREYSTGGWKPDWDTRSPEDKRRANEEIASQFSGASDIRRDNPGL